MQQALYRKYRSKNLSEVKGQDHITKTLSQAIKAKKIRHAYLLTGPHGVGKTSVARILAHEFNNLPYTGENHLDIIEIDAASNRRIDEIRDLREKVRIAPTSAKYKVYIIDEVHMLTNEAFNALLKTLEEPPAHAIFILATTELHKLPDTIVSRTQRFRFHPIKAPDAIKHLKEIAKAEKIKIDNDAIELLVSHSKGSFRDAISLLDQTTSSEKQKVTKSDIEELLGVASEDSISTMYESVIKKQDPQATLKNINNLFASGFDASSLASQLISFIHDNVLARANTKDIELINDLLSVPASSNPRMKLEIVLLSAAQPAVSSVQPAATAITPAKVSKPTFASPAPKIQPIAKPDTKPEVESTPIKTKRTVNNDTSGEKIEGWHVTLEGIKAKHSALYAMLKMSEARKKEDGSILLAFRFPFHQKQADEQKNRTLIAAMITKAFGPETPFSCGVDTTIKINDPTLISEDKKVEPDEKSSSVLDVMGGGEVIAFEES